jgi:hypothetical protein
MKESTSQLIERCCVRLVEVAGMVRADTNDVVNSADHIEIIRHYSQLRAATERIAEARKALDEMEVQLSREYVPDAMRAAKVKTVTIEGIGRVSLSNRFSCSIIAEPKTIGHEWLRNNGHGALVQETVNSSTLSSFAKNLTEEEGKELPEDIFKTSVMTFTSITKK